MISLIIGMAKVISIWWMLGFIYTGVGLFIVRRVYSQTLNATVLLMAPWVGWCLHIALLQIWHIAFPVGPVMFASMAILGVIGWVVQWKGVWEFVRARKACLRLMAILMVMASFWLALHTMCQPWMYDSGFYYLMSIRWASSYAAVPGLANLFGVLGFNNSYFLYAAMIDEALLPWRSHQVATGLLILLTLARGITAWCIMLRGVSAPQWRTLYDAACLIPVICWTIYSGHASSPSPDGAVYLLGLFLGSLWIDWLNQTNQPSNNHESILQWAIILIGCTGITMKISFSGWVAALFALLVLSRSHDANRIYLGSVTRMGVCMAAFLLPWSILGVITSGYIGYPAAVLGFPVDWRVPAEHAAGLVDKIVSWARQPWDGHMETLGNWRWIKPWFIRIWEEYDFHMRLPLAMTLGGLGIWRWRVSQNDFALPYQMLLRFMAPPLAGIVFCFASVPDPRFAGAAFWVLGAGVSTWTIQGVSRRHGVSMMVLMASVIAGAFIHPVDMVRNWYDAGPARKGLVEERSTRSGLKIFVPIETNQSWEAPLPATPYLNPDLQLRKADQLAKGFKIVPRAPRRSPSVLTEE